MQNSSCQNLESIVGSITRVDENIYGIILNKYANGYETTAGVVTELKIEKDIYSITYDSEHAVDLPFDWPSLLVLDDNNKRQHIKKIFFDSDKAYLMEDNSFSYTVTI